MDSAGASPIILEQQEIINEYLESKGIYKESEKVKILTRYLAAFQLALTFEKIYATIFGGQMTLLNQLNEARQQGMLMDNVYALISSIRAHYPEALGQWTNDQYLKFLFDSNLILKNEDKLGITELGIEFLVWVDKEGRKKYKQL